MTKSFFLVLALFLPQVSAADVILFSDNFDRSDSLTVGAPWIQGNQVTQEFSNATRPKLVGLGFTSIELDQLSFNYETHSQRASDYYSSSNAKPYVYAGLGSPVSEGTIRFRFSPHIDARVAYEIGLMPSSSSFTCAAVHGYCRPDDGVGVKLSRSSHAYSNSSILVYSHDNGVETELGRHSLPFQFESGNDYEVAIVVDASSSIVTNISVGGTTFSFTVQASVPSQTLDQVFIAGIDSGISFDSPGQITTATKFDDFELFVPGLLPPVEDLINDLIVTVINLNLHAGISNSLDAKLDSALAALDDANNANDAAAIGSLNSFINAVQAQSGKKISVEDADGLIAAAQQIIAELQ